MKPNNKILNLKEEGIELEIGPTKKKGRWHSIFNTVIAGIGVWRGYDVSTGREYIELLHVNPDQVWRKQVVIPRQGGRKERKNEESWIEVVDTSDQHIEQNETVKRWLKSGALRGIYKIEIKEMKLNKPFASIVEGLEYRLPE